MRGPRGGGLGCAGRAEADLGCAGRAAADLGCARRAASDARAGVFRLGNYREFDDVTWNDRGSSTMGCFTIGISSKQNGVQRDFNIMVYKETKIQRDFNIYWILVA